MQSEPSERIELAAIADGLYPDEQKRFTETPAVDFGMPASSAAWRPILGAPWRAIAEVAILDIVLVDAGALDGVLDGVSRPSTSAG